MHDSTSLRAFIDADPALAAILGELAERCDRDPRGSDPGHDVAHALRVALWTLRLAEGVDPRCSVAAALLHDAVNLPKDSPERSMASERSAELARTLLPPLGFDAAEVDAIATAIADHSYSRGATPRSTLGRALQDADRLEALGALGLCRTLSCGARMGARYFDPEDPWASRRPLDDRRFTVDHFFTKLLDLPRTMNTTTARREAERRAAFLWRFLEELAAEIGAPLER